jgi:hypothetical protein
VKTRESPVQASAPGRGPGKIGPGKTGPGKTGSDHGDVRDFCRAINEQILERADERRPASFLCECSDPGCFVALLIAPGAFREIAAAAARTYVVAPGHARSGRVERREAGFDVVLASELREETGSLANLLLRRVAYPPLQHPHAG